MESLTMSAVQEGSFIMPNYSSKIDEEKPLNNSPNSTRNEENPTHFLEINNSNYIDSSHEAVKLIKVKIIVPKGTLSNSKFNHKSNVLTVMNDIDGRIIFNVTENSEALKITNILNSTAEASTISKSNDCSTTEHNNKARTCPVMGTNALLAKTNCVKNTENQQELTDSALIQELVNERYQDSMIELYQRTFKRQTSRRSSLQTSQSISEASTNDKDLNCNFVNNIKHSSTVLNELDAMGGLVPPCEEYCDEIYPADGLVEPSSSTSCEDISMGDFNVDVTLGSAIDFILSTNGNTFNDNSRQQKSCSTNSNTGTTQSRSDFDEDKFLQRALGEELNGFESTNDDDKVTGSSETDKSDNSCISSQSVNSSEISTLLSKANSLYSTVSSKIRRLSRRIPLHASEDMISEEILTVDTTTSGTSERMARLKQESIAQHQIMMQTAKALQYCISVKEFVGSTEQVEGERMLLLANCKRQAILDIITKYEYDDDHAEDHYQQNSQGSITIANLTFHPKADKPSKSNRIKKDSGRNQWFVCIVNCNEFTYATQARIAEKDSGFLKFNETFQFDNLGVDFDLKVSLYAIKVKNAMKNYSHESKYHLKKDAKAANILCPPAPPSSFRNHRTLTRSNPTNPKHSFIPFGNSTLRLSNLITNSNRSSLNSNSKQFSLSKMPTNTSNQLSVVFTADVQTKLVVNATKAGFLTVGQGKITTWSRHWCELDGSVLRWWNYPQQEGVERTEELGSIDIRCCVTARITSVDRNICAKPRTLLLETIPCEPRLTYTRHLLSCDSADDLRMWERQLNTVLGILRSWNAMQSNSKLAVLCDETV